MTMEEFAEFAWADFLHFAIGNQEMVKAFKVDTGCTSFFDAADPISLMIDQACGKDVDDMAAFVEWVTINHWGIDNAPKSYRDMVANRAAPGADAEEM